MDPSSSGRRPYKKRSARPPTAINALSYDILCMIFASLDFFDLIRCSAVCKSWDTAINKSKLLQVLYCKKQQRKSIGLFDMATCSERSLKIHLEEQAMEQHKFSLQGRSIDVYQWKGHSVGVDQCRMKTGLILTGAGDKVMRLWSAESCKCLDEYFLPDKATLIDFDFDESKVVGLVGQRICIWRRNGKRNIFSSCEGLFTKGLCMRYIDPEAVVGCEDGTARIFDMYSRKCSQIIKMHAGPVACLSLGEDQLIVSGSSLGSITISSLSSDQRVASLRSPDIGGYASCWDLRTMRSLWITRASPNVLYSMHHLRNDKSTLVVGGIDGVLRILDQDTGEVFSRCIMDEGSRVSNSSNDGVIGRKRARRLPEDTRIDLITTRPPIRCLAVGMQKVVTTHNDKYIRIWKFRK